MKLLLIATTTAVISAAGLAHAFDRVTVNALKACHDYVWEVPEFKDLPNAAISVYPGSLDGDQRVINWNVNWDDPDVRAAGNCTYIGSEVVGFDDYAKQSE